MTAIHDLIASLEIGEPVTAGSTFMFPLFGAADGLGPITTLDQALAAGRVEVAETSAQGSVPELAIVNHADERLFLLDGEQVIGAKQNRTFNLSMLLPANSRTVVPVSCLEAGRWSIRGGKVRAAEHVHFAKGRRTKLRSVSESLLREASFRSDQHEVWRDIEDKLASAPRSSSTSAEADYFEQRRGELQPQLDDFAPQPGQCGAIVGTGERIVGVDLFGDSELYGALWAKLLNSYLLDALDEHQPAKPPARDGVRSTLEQLFWPPAAEFPAPGAGETLRWSGRHGSGAALVDAGRCIHAVAFCDA